MRFERRMKAALLVLAGLALASTQASAVVVFYNSTNSGTYGSSGPGAYPMYGATAHVGAMAPANPITGDLGFPTVTNTANDLPAFPLSSTSLTIGPDIYGLTDPVSGSPNKSVLRSHGPTAIHARTSIASTPEPTFYFLTGCGLAVLLAMALRRRAQKGQS